MSNPATTGMGRKILKTAGIGLAVLAGLLLVALVALYFLAEPLVERYLKKQVARESEGLYILQFDELQLSPATMGFTLRGLHFYPDTTVYRQQQENGQAGSSLLEVHSPKLALSGINLRGILFKNRLRIGAVVAERPVITLLAHDTAGADTTANNRRSNNGGGLAEVHIRTLDLQEGSFRYLARGGQNRLQHEVPHFSLRVQDLRLDNPGQQDLFTMLELEALELDVSNYTYLAPDSVYAVRVGEFSYSTRQQELKAEKVAIRADQQANAALPRAKAHRSLYQVQTPLLHITGLNVAAAWRSGLLQLDRVLLEHPDLQVHEDLTLPDSSSFTSLADVYASLLPYLREIGIQDLRLTDGSFRYQQQNDAVFTVHQLDKANITLQALQLDSATLFTPKEKPFAEELLVAFGSYTYSPLHSPYTVTTGRLELNTRTSTLAADAIHIAGDWQKNDSLKSRNQAKRTFYDISLPSLRFRDLGLLQAFRTSRLVIGRIAVENPAIDVRTDKRVPKPGKAPNLQEMYEQISGLVSELEVGEIRVTDAVLTHHVKSSSAGRLHRAQLLEHAALLVNGLLLDSAYVYNIREKLPVEDLVLSATNYTYQKPDQTYIYALGSLRYSSRSQELTASSIDVISSIRANDRQKVFDNASRSLFDLSATKFRVTGVDLVKALNTGHLSADEVILRQPDLAILLDRQVAEAPAGRQRQNVAEELFLSITSITVNTLRLEDGTFTFSEKQEPIMRTHVLEHASASVSGIHLTPGKLQALKDKLPLQEMRLTATDYTFRTIDSIYTIRLDSLHYSSRSQELIARTFTVSSDRQVNERLKADKPELASRNLFDIAARKFRISGFDLVRAYASGRYHMDEMLLTAPEVAILQDHNVPLDNKKAAAATDTSAGSQVAEKVAELVETFRVRHLRVIDGTVKFDILEDTIRKSQTIDNVALTVEQLRLVSLEATDPLDIFDVDDMDIVVQGYSFFTRDSLYVLKVKEIRSTLLLHILSADSLRLQPLFEKEEYADKLTYAADRVDLEVAGLDLQGLSLRALFNNQDIIAHKLHIRQPDVELYRDNRLGFHPERRPPTVQKALREAGLYIRLDTVLLERTHLVHPVIAIDGLEPAIFLLKDMRLVIYNVTNDSVRIRQNNRMPAHGSALLMGESLLEVDFVFELDHPEDRYTYEGSLEPMDLTGFNPLFEKLMFIRIVSGQTKKAFFSVEATEHKATGELRFPYNNLKIELLDKEDPDNPGFLLKAGTRLVNLLVIKTNNPSGLGIFRKGHIEEDRDYQRAVTNHMGKSLLNGILSSVMTNLVERIVTRFVEL